jgi:hypothetical protein
MLRVALCTDETTRSSTREWQKAKEHYCYDQPRAPGHETETNSPSLEKNDSVFAGTSDSLSPSARDRDVAKAEDIRTR